MEGRGEGRGERALATADMGAGLAGREGRGDVGRERPARGVSGKVNPEALLNARGRTWWARADNGVPGRRTSGIPRLGATSIERERRLFFLAFRTTASLARSDMCPNAGDAGRSECDRACGGDRTGVTALVQSVDDDEDWRMGCGKRTQRLFEQIMELLL